MRTGLLATFIAAMAIIAWDEVKVQQRIPHPERFVHAGVVWAILGVIAELGVPELATVFGFGLVLSMLYTQYNGTSSTHAVFGALSQPTQNTVGGSFSNPLAGQVNPAN